VLGPEEALTAYELSCDVAVFVYDVSNPMSFEYCASIYKVLVVGDCMYATMHSALLPPHTGAMCVCGEQGRSTAHAIAAI
jgi:hypothetical protein